MPLQPDLSKDLDSIAPGVVAAYEGLRANNDMGLYTSAGAFYNHTLFGRDASSVVGIVAPFDFEVAEEAIVALAALQGTKTNPTTQEEPGRIHHEYRDFESWKPEKLFDTLAMKLLRRLWGGNSKELLTYFATDPTASFINLVYTYTQATDMSILDHEFTNKDNEHLTIREAVRQAADWLTKQVGSDGVVVTRRTNGWSLPYQTYEDSPTSYASPTGQLANFKRPLAYIEVQGLTIDALRGASMLMGKPGDSWQKTADKIAASTLEKFWMKDDQYFASALEQTDSGWQHITTHNITAGWVLSSSLLDNLNSKDQERYVAPVVKRLFSDEFLTDLGLRTRSIKQKGTLDKVMEYHGAHAIWPMYTYLVARSLQKHRMPELAKQLEYRLINAINWSGIFDELFIVDDKGHVLWKPKEHVVSIFNPAAIGVQMFPEEKMGLTIVPAITMARDILQKTATPKAQNWQQKLEKDVLSTIKNVERYTGEELEAKRPPTSALKVSRSKGLLKTTVYLVRQITKLKK